MIALTIKHAPGGSNIDPIHVVELGKMGPSNLIILGSSKCFRLDRINTKRRPGTDEIDDEEANEIQAFRMPSVSAGSVRAEIGLWRQIQTPQGGEIGG